jgi:hypothetical protein
MNGISSILDWGKMFIFLHKVQTQYVAHLTYQIQTARGSVSWGKAAGAMSQYQY